MKNDFETLSTYYQTFLKDLYTPKPEPRIVAGKSYFDDEVIQEVYESCPSERTYIKRVLDDYINGANRYQTKRRFLQNIICPFLYVRKKEAKKLRQVDELIEGDTINGRKEKNI